MVNFMIAQAREIGDKVRESAGRVRLVEKKLKHDIVTELDYSTEKALIRAIRFAFPDHAVFTEEMGFVGRKSSQYVWVVDPIDGTINYAAGLPIYNISIALAVRGQVVLGIIYEPTTDFTVFARKGHGAFINGKRIDRRLATSPHTSLKDALVYLSISTHDDVGIVDQTLKLWRQLHPNVRGIRMLGSSALGLAYVSCGVIDAMVRFEADPWGAAAGSLLVKESGGKFTTIDGNPWHVHFDKEKHEGFIATNQYLYDKIFRLVEKTKVNSKTDRPGDSRS